MQTSWLVESRGAIESAYNRLVHEALSRVLAADPRIAYALLFGSNARGTAHAHSDADVAIGLAPGIRLAALEIGALVASLEAAAGRPVDLVLLDEAPPALAYRIFRDGRPLLVRDRAAMVARKADAILEYLDFQPFEEIFVRRILEGERRGR